MIHQTIKAVVSEETIQRVTRLFNGSISDVLNELLQNSRRAGATRIEIVTEPFGETPDLLIRINDDGTGIADPQSLLALGLSQWSDATRENEDPAGMGVFSLAGRNVTISSRHRDSDKGWTVNITHDAWTGGVEIPVKETSHPYGTTIEFAVCGEETRFLTSYIQKAARHYLLPVTLNGDPLHQVPFLENALWVKEWHGSHIGVFKSSRKETINFHGLQVSCNLPSVKRFRVGHAAYHVALDVGSTPELKLVLPARKEVVQNDALVSLKIACKQAIYEYIASLGEHELAFSDWEEARNLGIALPEARKELRIWSPMDAEYDYVTVKTCEVTPDCILVENSIPAIEQCFERAVRDHPIRQKMLGTHDPYKGYSWYDALETITDIEFKAYHDDKTTVINFDSIECSGINEDAIELCEHIECKRICATATFALGGTTTLHSFETDIALVAEVGGIIDEFTLFYIPGENVTPNVVAQLLMDSIFSASDDPESDAPDTQRKSFHDDAFKIATSILMNEDEALKVAIKSSLETCLWHIPKNKLVTIRVDGSTITVDLEDKPEMGEKTPTESDTTR